MITAENPLRSGILVVDDKPENLRLLANILKERGYSVRPLRDGRMVMPSALTSQPDLILLDIMMPEMDGYEVCRQLKANPHTASIPVIFISALDEVADKVRAFSLGGVDYISKPFQAEEVIARVETHLSIRRLQKDLEQARLAAEAANRAKSAFLANMSHEIRTPMNSVLGFLSLVLESSELSEKNRSYLLTAYRSSKSLLDLINDILDISKLESGRLELENCPFDLVTLTEDTLRVFDIRCREKGLNLSLHLDPDLPRYFSGDPLRLRQILVNLVGNAIKFTEKGHVHAEVKNADMKNPESAPHSAFIHFSVSDTGIGIPADRLDNIFEPFTQADSSTSRKYGGTGLGTTISRQLAKLMHGEIWAESEVGKGSTFHFTVGLTTLETIPDQKTECTELPPSRCFKILIAEDVEENLMLAKIRLTRKGHTVIEARNGHEAVAAFEREKPDIVLMDVHMPEMDGLEAARRIREMEGNTAEPVPILALTASVMKQEQKICMEAGMSAVIGKPVSFDELFKTMEKTVPPARGKIQISAEKPKTESQQIPQDYEGIDFTKGLAVWQDEKLYKKSLLRFSGEYRHAAEQMRRQVENRDTEGAYRLSHALMGVSGNLFLPEVYRIASELSGRVRENSAAQLLPLIQSLEDALRTVALSLAQMQTETADDALTAELCADPADSFLLGELLGQLLKSFGECDPEAADPVIDQLAGFVSRQQIAQIQRHLDRFDFDKAGEECVKLAHRAGIAL